jgi:hypothetical protein
MRRHHVLLTTQRAITNHKDFSKMQRLLVSFYLIHYSYQIGTYWNLYPVHSEFSYFTTFFNGTFRYTGIHSVHLAEEFAGCLLKQIRTLNI